MIQYNETDYNHLHRRREAEGIHYHDEHRLDGHTLHLCDSSTVPRSIDAADSVMRFDGAGGAIEQDGIQRWETVRTIATASVRYIGFEDRWPGTLTADRTNWSEQEGGRLRAHEQC